MQLCRAGASHDIVALSLSASLSTASDAATDAERRQQTVYHAAAGAPAIARDENIQQHLSCRLRRQTNSREIHL